MQKQCTGFKAIYRRVKASVGMFVFYSSGGETFSRFVKIQGSCRNQSSTDLKLNVFHLTCPATSRPSKALKFNILLQTLQTCVGTLQVADVSSSKASTVRVLSKTDLLQPSSRSLLRTVLSFSNMDLEKNRRMYSSCFCSNLQSVCGFSFVCLCVSG